MNNYSYEANKEIEELTAENTQLKALNGELVEALEKIIRINAAPSLDLLIEKLKDVAKAALTKSSSTTTQE